MPFAVDYTTTIDDVTIKCSKPFNELGTITIDDLLPYAISGIHDIGVGRAGLSCETFSNYTDIENNTPVEYINSSWSDVRVKYHTEYNPLRANPHYGFVILAYGTTWQNITSATDNARLVLDIPIQKIFVDMPTYSKNTINKVNDGDDSTVDTIEWYNTNDTGTIRTVSNNTAITNLQILTVFVLNDSNFIIMNTTGQKGAPFVHTTYTWHGNTGNARGGTSGTTSFLPYYSTTYLGNTARYVNMANDDALSNKTFGNVDWSRNFVILYDTPENQHEQTNSYVVITYTGAGPPDFDGTVTFYPKGGERSAMLGFANSCLKFKYGNTMYKPLISDGAVYDYTDDMAKENEFDNIATVTGNNVPLSPPTPPPPDKHDNEVDMDLIHLSSLNGFVRYYIMGISTADDLAAALNRFDITLTGKDLLPNLISYKMFAIPESAFLEGTSRTITIAGHEMKRADDSAIQAPIVLDINPITLDSITINNVYNDFRDYAPYTKIEMFVPFCGWFSLPSWAMGRTISGSLYVDLPNGSVKAVIKASSTVIAEVGGACAVDVPLVAQAVGSKAAAIISNMTTGAVAAFNPTPQGIISASMGIATAFNNNYTQSKGVMGDGSNVQGLDRVYIKVTRPAPTDTTNGVMTDAYKHERGIPCGKTIRIKSGDGFTQIMDANIVGTMTDREKQMIIDGFRHGLIL